VDVDGDGKPEVFVGTWYRKSGPNTWLWTGYTPVAGGYRRITLADVDMLIDFNQIYVGPIPELHRQGMVQGYSLELDNQQRDQSNLLSDVTYYYLEGGKLVQQGTGPLDRDDPEQQRRYNFFFGPDRRVRETPRIESFKRGRARPARLPCAALVKMINPGEAALNQSRAKSGGDSTEVVASRWN
jgi:hypothetical protein